MTQLTGRLAREIYRNGDFAIGVFRPNKEPSRDITILGSLPPCSSVETLEITGEWESNEKYGKQFRVAFAAAPTISNGGDLALYLTHHVKGIGPAKAKKIVSHFGDSLQSVITSNPDRLFEVKGVTKQMQADILASWNRNSALKTMEIYLSKIGITPIWAPKLLRTLGNNALKKLQANPYVLTNVRGLGFKKADEAAEKAGWTKNRPERVLAVMIWLLQEAESEGHLCLPRDVLINKAATDCVVGVELADQMLNQLVQNEELKEYIVSTQHADVSVLYLPWNFYAEKHVAEYVWNHSQSVNSKNINSVWVNASLDTYQKKVGLTLTDKQIEAVHATLSQKLSLLTGGPGCGKTATIQAIVTLADALGWRIGLMAPTGRAAKNMENLSKFPASTIHRGLEYYCKENESKSNFFRNKNNKLEYDLVIIDEVSMVDLHLFHSFIQAVPNHCHVLLVGDDNQLPSVGAGTVLKDLLRFPHIHRVVLDKIHRQAEKSLIITNAHKVLHGQTPTFPPKDPQGTYMADSVQMEAPLTSTGGEDTARIREQIKQICTVTVPTRFNLNPITDIQVLTPMKRGECGVEDLNSYLQGILNPHGHPIKLKDIQFRIGDRIMITRNHPELDVFNGDTGNLVGYDAAAKLIKLNVSGKKIDFPVKHSYDLTLGYASTVHKVQGGEYPVVILVLLKRHFVMLQRPLLYTGMTRPKKQIFFLGSKQAIEMAVNNNETQNRNSFLWHRLNTYHASKH